MAGWVDYLRMLLGWKSSSPTVVTVTAVVQFNIKMDYIQPVEVSFTSIQSQPIELSYVVTNDITLSGM